MFNVYIATRSGNVFHNEKILVDLDKDFKTGEVMMLLNGEQVPYTRDERGNVIDYCFINENNVEGIKTRYANFEDRRLLPVISYELTYVRKNTLSDYYTRLLRIMTNELEKVLKTIK